MDFLKQAIVDFKRKEIAKFEVSIIRKLQDNLSKFYNIRFSSDVPFYNFCKERITMVDDVENQQRFFFLDYVSEENHGKMVLSYSTKVDLNFSQDGRTATISFG